MLSIIGEQFGSVISTALKLLYRLPGEEWLDTGTLLSLPGASGDDSV